ncbi:peptide-methionine (R)-S-oxide reductase MsrB [Myroides sp. LoEW2-1]|nr:peptide-methionine (R)-S-oxide reductase MsrB [Myroides sp. LoEW2-1]MVX34861.1 peptide-methionine (R)-S-oxide reductase MsrB [Myroides sp. LoEW2-1]
MEKNQNTSEEQWREILTPEEYFVLRQKGTERPFTGEYNDFYEKGSYHCAACNQKLFDSNTKFDSHCGWPSFDQAIKGSVKYIKDLSHGMVRTEVVCSNCNGHLGHVFPDGPQETTGERYCMNSISLKFQSEEK